MSDLGDLQKAVERFPDEVEAALADAVREEAQEIVADEKRRIRVGPTAPHARDHIEARIDGTRAEVGIFDPRFLYVIFLEWGRKNAAAQPFATPAAELARRRFVKRAEEAVKEAVNG